MITVNSLRARAARLHQLVIGLGQEVARIKKDDSPLLFLERQDYLGRLQDGIAGLDAARIALASALARIKEDAAARGG